ncbi:MAG: hypothetical protein AB7S70_11525 [Hyphomicrobium sp.]
MKHDRHLVNPEHRAARSRVLGCTLLVVLGTALSGCGDEAPTRENGERPGSQHDAPHGARWLEVSSPISPAQWLASRGAERLKPLHDPEVARIAGVLAAAHSRYRESERMIANRSAQLSEMLHARGIDESAADILDDLSVIGGEIDQTEGFGAVSQHYFNLRAGGMSRTDSLAALRTRYGSRS